MQKKERKSDKVQHEAKACRPFDLVNKFTDEKAFA